MAVQRFAAPVPSGTMNCSSVADACDIQMAVESAAATDEVILAAGDYMVGADQLDLALPETVHGADGQARPRIITSSGVGVSVTDAAAVLRRVEIEHSFDGGDALFMNSGTVEQAFVHTLDGISACTLAGGTIRDSVCWDTRAAGSVGLKLGGGGGPPRTATARNVTAVATSPASAGIAVNASTGSTVILNATSVIGDAPLADAVAFNDGAVGSSAALNLDRSNYATELETGAPASVTDPGTLTNQTGAPLFANAATGDFHQLLGSPTIDMGIGGAGLGTADIDGQARIQGALPDIGADEFTPAAPPPAAGTTKKCKKKKRKKRAAPAAKKCKKKKKR